MQHALDLDGGNGGAQQRGQQGRLEGDDDSWGESCRKPESPATKVRYLFLPGGSPRKILSQSGQIGNRDGSREGTQTLPQSATIGSPVTALSTMRSLGT